jgi:hypothetical protein
MRKMIIFIVCLILLELYILEFDITAVIVLGSLGLLLIILNLIKEKIEKDLNE